MVAENVAETCGISRLEQDKFAVQSQVKCEEAVSLQHFDTEIEPILISSSRRILNYLETKIVDSCSDYFLDDVEVRQDEHPRKGISIDSMSKLNTIYKGGKLFI